MDLQLIATWAIGILTSGSLASLVIEWVKNKLGWSNGNAEILAAVGATLFALLTVWASGQLLPGTIEWSDFWAVLLLILKTSQVFYRKWLKG